MTNILYIFIFAVLFVVKLSCAHYSPELPYPQSKLGDGEYYRNPIREIYRRKTDSLDYHPVKRKNTPTDAQTKPIRFGSEIFDKLRSAGTQDTAQQPNGQYPGQGNEQGSKRGEFISDDPKYLLDDTSSYQQAIKSLQQILKGVQSGTNNMPGNMNVYNKDNTNKERQDLRMKNLRWKRKLPGDRKKRLGRAFRSEKGYLDYTNSQMPFNEGTKRSLKEQERRQESKGDGGSKESNESNYSRVRRYLDQERIRKRIKGSATLEAKEAAMSRVLDPNLNLDGILEPHIRKRRYSFRRGIQRNHIR